MRNTKESLQAILNHLKNGESIVKYNGYIVGACLPSEKEKKHFDKLNGIGDFFMIKYETKAPEYLDEDVVTHSITIYPSYPNRYHFIEL